VEPAATAPPSRNMTATHSWRRSGQGRGRSAAPEALSWERYVQAVYVVNVVAARAVCNYKVRADSGLFEQHCLMS